MRDQATTAAMFWTGGKDSAMALYEAERNGYDIRCLVTFAPRNPDFLAHPLSFVKVQSRALGLPHYVYTVDAPFEQGYEARLREMRDELDIECVVTGDIEQMNGHPNWIQERSRAAGLAVHTPLWRRNRDALLQQFLDRGFSAYVSCVNTRWLGANWVGRKLDKSAVADLQAATASAGLDLCGEKGEYHTVVTNGPSFTQPVAIRSYMRRVSEHLAYMEIEEVELANDTAA